VAKQSSKKAVSGKGKAAPAAPAKPARVKLLIKSAGKPLPAKFSKNIRAAESKPASVTTSKFRPAPKVSRMEAPAPMIPQAPAVPTDGKPRRNVAGFSSKELEVFRDLILAKRREIVGDMSSMEREALRSSGGTNLSNLPIHMADMGTDNYEQEFTLGLMEKDRKLLRDLNDALAKLQNGTYGICEGTGKPISRARLDAQPWARYSIEYARKLERRIP
jgi:RNA polymerase-binding protein DksA